MSLLKSSMRHCNMCTTITHFSGSYLHPIVVFVYVRAWIGMHIVSRFRSSELVGMDLRRGTGAVTLTGGRYWFKRISPGKHILAVAV
eukprot:355647-Chlamydomonas_euryale.AAC.1